MACCGAVWAPVTDKLLCVRQANFKKRLIGIGHEIQATCLAEVDEEAVREKVTRV